MFNFPWSNFHELNLDWILSVVKEAKEIFVKGEGDIQYAVETADQALETAEQAAAGVIADGAVTIPKLNSEVYSLLAYCVSGSVAPNFIPAGALVILRKSTIYNVTDGIYTATRNIPQAAIITAADLDQSATLYREGGMNYILHNVEKLSGTIDLIKAGLVILVTGDDASAAVPADGLVYVVNNTHGLTEGFYFNSSGAPFPPTGGTADSDSFTAVNNILNALQTAIATLGSDDIANDSTVTGASVTDALDAVKNTLTQLDSRVDSAQNDIAIILQDPAQDTFTEGTYVVYNNQLYTVNQGGIPQNTPASSYYPNSLTAVPGGGFNSIKASLPNFTITKYELSNFIGSDLATSGTGCKDFAAASGFPPFYYTKYGYSKTNIVSDGTVFIIDGVMNNATGSAYASFMCMGNNVTGASVWFVTEFN